MTDYILEDGAYLYEAKWYDKHIHMLSLSRKYPDYIFEVAYEGEDSEDRGNTYYYNGKREDCPIQIIYPEPNLKKLGVDLDPNPLEFEIA